MSRIFAKCLVMEITVVVLVTITFRAIENRLVAGAIAGGMFIALGVFIVGFAVKWRAFLRTATFWLGCMHLFLVALPMVVIRLLNAEGQFSQDRIWGLSGPLFHRVSTGLYLTLMISTAFDWWRVKNRERVEKK